MATAPIPVGNFPLRTLPLEGRDVPSARFTYPWLKWMQELEIVRAKADVFFTGTHAQRVGHSASGFPDGSVFQEADRTVFYMVVGAQWIFLAGCYQATYANLPADLTTTDAGFRFNVTDFAHELQWTGSGWQWAPGENGSGYIMTTWVTPPLGVLGWHVCDGSVNVAQLNSDGTQSFVTLPVTAGAYFRQ